jgi:hypothetical protein
VNTSPAAPGRTVGQILRAKDKLAILTAARARVLRDGTITFAVQLPPASVLLQVAGVVFAAIGGLTLWRRLRPPG